MSYQQGDITVLITGASGQLGYALQKTVPDKLNSSSIDLIAVTRAQLNLAQPSTIVEVLDKYQPDIIINAAAYTAVDKAENDIEMADVINHRAVAEIAKWCAKKQKMLVQISTDFVFDGKASAPYLPESKCEPLGIYGKTKYAGEMTALDANPKTYVVRTGWVYCEHGSNFVKTMLRLGAERDSLGVVSDQIGTPTYAIHLAEMIWVLLDKQPAQRVFHFSDAGTASWYDFANAIFILAGQKGLISQLPQVKPIRTSDYPTPAQRPSYSVLDKFQTWGQLGVQPVHWQVALSTMLDRLIK